MADYDYLDDEELKRSMDPEPGSGVSLPDDHEDTASTPAEAADTTTQTPEAASTAEDAASQGEAPEAADKRRLQDIYRSALSRYGQRPNDDSDFRRLQLFGLLGQGLGQLSSGIARQQAAGYFGGTADPTAVAGARAQLMQQANQAGEPIAQLAQAPVQQYIQRRQQELAGQKQNATELLDLGKAQYYANGGRQGAASNFTPEDIARAQQTARAMGVPEDALAGVTPKNVDKIIAEQGRGARNAANIAQRDRALAQRLDEIELKLADHRTSAAERQSLLRERLEVQKARLQLQGAVQGNKAEADVGARQVPGVEFEQPISTQDAKDLRDRQGYSAEADRALGALTAAARGATVNGKLNMTTEEYGRLRAQYNTALQKLMTGEYGKSFTEGHAMQAARILPNDLQGFGGLLKTPAFIGSLESAREELGHAYSAAITARSGHFLDPNNPFSGAAGRTKGYSAEPVRAAKKKIDTVTGNAPVHYVSPQNPDGWNIPPDKVKEFERLHPEAKPSGG